MKFLVTAAAPWCLWPQFSSLPPLVKPLMRITFQGSVSIPSFHRKTLQELPNSPGDPGPQTSLEQLTPMVAVRENMDRGETGAPKVGLTSASSTGKKLAYLLSEFSQCLLSFPFLSIFLSGGAHSENLRERLLA